MGDGLLKRVPAYMKINTTFTNEATKEEKTQAIRDYHGVGLNCARTSDGMYIQFLYPNLKTDPPLMAGMLGWKATFYSGTIWAMVTDAMWSSQPLFEKMKPVFKSWNTTMHSAVEALTYKEFCNIAYGGTEFKGDQVFRHIPVVAPSNVLELDQHHHTQTFVYVDSGPAVAPSSGSEGTPVDSPQWFISTPCRLSSFDCRIQGHDILNTK